MAKKRGYSKKARANAAIARSIKSLLGKGAYEAYKRTGTYDKSKLEAARKSKKTTRRSRAKKPAAPTQKRRSQKTREKGFLGKTDVQRLRSYSNNVPDLVRERLNKFLDKSADKGDAYLPDEFTPNEIRSIADALEPAANRQSQYDSPYAGGIARTIARLRKIADAQEKAGVGPGPEVDPRTHVDIPAPVPSGSEVATFASRAREQHGGGLMDYYDELGGRGFGVTVHSAHQPSSKGKKFSIYEIDRGMSGGPYPEIISADTTRELGDKWDAFVAKQKTTSKQSKKGTKKPPKSSGNAAASKLSSIEREQLRQERQSSKEPVKLPWVESAPVSEGRVELKEGMTGLELGAKLLVLPQSNLTEIRLSNGDRVYFKVTAADRANARGGSFKVTKADGTKKSFRNEYKAADFVLGTKDPNERSKEDSGPRGRPIVQSNPTGPRLIRGQLSDATDEELVEVAANLREFGNPNDSTERAHAQEVNREMERRGLGGEPIKFPRVESIQPKAQGKSAESEKTALDDLADRLYEGITSSDELSALLMTSDDDLRATNPDSIKAILGHLRSNRSELDPEVFDTLSRIHEVRQDILVGREDRPLSPNFFIKAEPLIEAIYDDDANGFSRALAHMENREVEDFAEQFPDTVDTAIINFEGPPENKPWVDIMKKVFAGESLTPQASLSEEPVKFPRVEAAKLSRSEELKLVADTNFQELSDQELWAIQPDDPRRRMAEGELMRRGAEMGKAIEKLREEEEAREEFADTPEQISAVDNAIAALHEGPPKDEDAGLEVVSLRVRLRQAIAGGDVEKIVRLTKELKEAMGEKSFEAAQKKDVKSGGGKRLSKSEIKKYSNYKKSFEAAASEATHRFDPKKAAPEWLTEEGTVAGTSLEFYEGVDFSVDNVWVEGDEIFVGSPYRKEVSPDDDLGSYQSVSFKIDPEGGYFVKGSKQWDAYYEAITFEDREGNSYTLADLIKNKTPLTDLQDNPDILFDTMYSEIGLMY